MKNSNYTLWKRITSSPIVLIVAIIALFFLARSVWNVHKGSNIVAFKLDEAQSELSHLNDQQGVLTGKIAQLSTPQGVESELRTKYRAVKEGEFVAVVLDVDKPTVMVATSTPQLGWWDRFVGFLGF